MAIEDFVQLPEDGDGKKLKTFVPDTPGDEHLEPTVITDVEGQPVELALEATLLAAKNLLTQLEAKDFAEETTLEAARLLLSSINALTLVVRNRHAPVEPFSEVASNPFSGTGDHVLHTPAPGNAVRLRWYQLHQDPDDDTSEKPVVTVKVGTRVLFVDKWEAGLPFSRGTLHEGAVGEEVILNLNGAGTIYVNGEVEEYIP